jgi:hypothetical protein
VLERRSRSARRNVAFGLAIADPLLPLS